MNSLTNKEIKDSYKDLLQISNNNVGISNELQSIYDGAGNLSPLKISSTSISVDGELDATNLKILSKSVATQEWVNTNVQGGLTNWSETNGHIIPNNNASFDLGNAEYKVRHLFLSDNSIWIGDDFKQEGGVKKKINKTKLPFWFSVNLPNVLENEIINWYNLEFKDSNLPEATALENLSLSAIIEFAKTKSGNQELSASDIYPSEKKSDGSVNDNYSSTDYEYIVDDEQSYNVNNFLSNLFESTDNQNKILQVSESGDGITFVETESLRGEQGIQGEQGIAGSKGDLGQKGEAGTSGEKGEQGIQGEQGIAGLKGDIGLKGEKGEIAPRGIDGDVGEKGEKGEQGIVGLQGDQGDQGADGKSAYEIYSENTSPALPELDWLASLQGVNGEKGEKGNTGDTGSAGADGASVWTTVGSTESDIAYITGNVGIGTDAPNFKLDLSAEKSNSFISRIWNTSTELEASGLQVRCSGGAGGHSLAVYKDDAYQFTIKNNGNVGIGITSPEQKLHIAGGTPGVKLEGTQPRIWLSENDTSNLNTLIRNINGKLQIDTVKDDDSFVENRLTIKHSDGKVGIGTADPNALLDLKLTSGHPLYIRSGTEADDNLFLFENPLNTGQGPQFSMYERDTTNIKVRLSTYGDSYFTGGNVGIGTTSPNYRLTVTDTNAGGDIGIRLQNNSTTDDTTASLRLATTTNDTYSTGFITAGRTPAPYMQFGVANNVMAMRIDSNGNVGIGTTSPGAVLEIKDANVNGYIFKAGDSVADRFCIVSGGKVGIGTVSPALQLDVVGGIQMSGDQFWYKGGAFRFINRTSGSSVESMRISDAGNVGIGLTSPNAKLDVKFFGSGKIAHQIQTNDASSYAINHIGGGGADDVKFRVNGGGGVYAAGNVGIGTTSPSARLEIAGGGTGVWLKTNNITNRSSMAGQGYINLTNQIPTDENTFEIGPGYINLNRDDHNAINQLSFGMNGAIAAAISVGRDKDSAALDSLRFKVGRNDANKTGLERMRIAQNGNIGINNINPDTPLHVSGATTIAAPTFNNYALLDLVGSNNSQIASIARIASHAGSHNNASSILTFSTRNNENTIAEKMRIDSDGRVGINQINPKFGLDIKNKNGIVVRDAPGNQNSQTNIIRSSTSSVTHDNWGVGISVVNENISSNGYGMAFYTRNAYNGSYSEKVRISKDGKVGIATVDPGSYHLFVLGDIGCTDLVESSDDRIKHNEQPIVNAIETINKLTPKKYIKTKEMYDADHDFELDDQNQPINKQGEPVDHSISSGFIAQDLLQIKELSHVVTDEIKDDEDVIKHPMGVNYNSLYAYAIAAIQEQQKMIENLTNKVSDLQNQLDTKNTPPAS